MIALRGVELERRTREEHGFDLKTRLFALAAGRYRAPRRKMVIAGVDLDVRRGEKVGVIGPNGAGKTTLLKLICGVLTPTAGTIEIDGTVAALLELGAGFDPELSVVDNIILYGVLLGVDRRAIASRIDAILAFAELQEYRGYPVSALSSGMTARLGFAVATDVEPDVLLVDEALAVGDAHFRAKSRARIDELWHADRTVVLVSHDLMMVRAICERAIWIDRGRIAADGEPDDVIYRYVRAVDAAAEDALLRARS